ncbi:MAG TPA: sarcosine oxidase subunit gamma family protein [Steroidobacter sp.]|uniref:sarcosine oxidase subunit gamma family protein n=1 Tax=Steroidobacter sp. TaxID=1978227 RepID=UPI002EDA6957
MKPESQSSLRRQFGTLSTVADRISDKLEVRERADIGCVLLNAAVNSVDIIDAGSAAVGVQLPAGAGLISTVPRRSAMWLTPRAWLILCSAEDEIALASRVDAAFPEKRLHAALFTDYLCWLELRGQSAEECLQYGAFISLERGGLAVGHGKRTLIAGITAVTIHQSRFEWLVAIERSRAEYFAAWLKRSLQAHTGHI